MLKYTRNLVLDIFDYSGNKQCSLYDQTSDVSGQAHDVVKTTERNGWKELTFVLPQLMHTENGDERNFRLDYIKEGYSIRLIDDDGIDWFILSETKIVHNNYTKTLTITAGHVCQLLKHKRLDLEFSDDEGNNVGTAETLLETILEGTGWAPGYVDTFYEKNGRDVKYRTMKASAKSGAFKLIASMCDLFEAKPVYNGDSKTVDIVPLNPFSEPKNGALPDVEADDVVELHYGKNVSNVVRTLSEENLITKLYAYGSYGDKDEGYCGIDECTHHVYTLVVGSPVDPGSECQMNLTDVYGINFVRYFKIQSESTPKNLQKISKVLWSDLDPASRMYVWDPVNNVAYFLYESLQGSECEAFFTEDESLRKEEANWFSFLMDFDYYRDIGLFTDEMLQALARYQIYTPGNMEVVSTEALSFSDSITTLSETIGASADFCKLDCEIIKPVSGYVQLQLRKTSAHPDGVIYRTDYDKKEDKHFKWRVAEELKPNGDPVTGSPSIVYIVYDQRTGSNPLPVMFDKVYIKEIDNEDNPGVITLWLSAADCKYDRQNFRAYLFEYQGINGYLGAYESADESLATTLSSSTKISTVEHPVYFKKEEPEINTTKLNGYGWWWKWYEGYDTPSEMYFCWTNAGDEQWKRVIVSDTDPNGETGYYWYNWRKAVIYRKESGKWVNKAEDTQNKNVVRVFGTVYSECLRRDSLYKGTYEQYTYVSNTNLPVGNYAIANGYGGYWAFTTTQRLAPWDELTYSVVQGTKLVTQTVDGVEQQLATTYYGFDSITYHPYNVIDGASIEQGGLSASSTAGKYTVTETNSSKYRTGFIKIYPNLTYHCSGYNGSYAVFYFDKNRNYLSKVTVSYGLDEDIVTPNGAAYIRLVGDMDFTTEPAVISVGDVENKFIVNGEETYTVLQNVQRVGELRGIVSLTKKFADAADEAYGTKLNIVRTAQDLVKEMQLEMVDTLGDLYREGFWQKNDYVDGDEQKLYDDAFDNLEKLSKPEAKYEITYLDLYSADYENEYNGADVDSKKILWPDVSTAKAAHLIDPDVKINTWAFIDKVQKCYDQPWKTKITINTNLTTISQHSFTDVMSHIAEVSNETKGRMSLYERAKAITDNGTIAAQRLEGAIDANKVMITGGSSTWYTDDNGNMVFVSADGNGAMTITGNGFAVANSKDEWGDWNWRTFGTAAGFSADEIITGYLSAERILAGSITADRLDAGVAGELDLTANRSLRLIVSDLLESVDEKISTASISLTPEEIVQKVESVESFVEKYATKEEMADTYLTKDAAAGIIGYRLEITSTTDVLSEAMNTTTLNAKVYYGTEDVTDTLDASMFNWKRTSGDSTKDAIWNSESSHQGVKTITLTTSDVPYTATYSCELIGDEEG